MLIFLLLYFMLIWFSVIVVAQTWPIRQSFHHHHISGNDITMRRLLPKLNLTAHIYKNQLPLCKWCDSSLTAWQLLNNTFEQLFFLARLTLCARCKHHHTDKVLLNGFPQSIRISTSINYTNCGKHTCENNCQIYLNF